MSQTRHRTVHKERYYAVDDAGVRHSIDVYADMQSGTNLDNSTWQAEGLKSHKMTANGGHVNVNPDGTLEEVATGRKLTRV